MAGRTDGLIKNFKASGAIPPRRLLKFGAADDVVTLATAATDEIIGASGELAAADGEPCDVHLSGIAEVTYGGNVARGKMLTAGADGKAVAAAPAAGANNRIGGIAFATGVDGDVGVMFVLPSQIQGA